MKRGLLIQFVLLFALVLVGYALVFGWIERRRVTKGPWEITFSSKAEHPELIIQQPTLNIRDVRIVFADAIAPSNTVERIQFTKAQNPPYAVPFGECIFQDLLFLPGTVTLKLFGHEIQLIPRTLTINQQERPWQNGETIELRTIGTNSIPATNHQPITPVK